MHRIIRIGLLLMCLLLTGCGVKENSAELAIKVNDSNIDYLLRAEPFRTREDFKSAYSEIDSKELVYVPVGSEVSIAPAGQYEKVIVKAYWIDKEGFPNYKLPNGEPLDMDVKVEKTGDSKCEFTVEKLLQAGLSSYYEENEKITAGYVIELHKGEEAQYCYLLLQIDKN